jgi:hypothetical protein
LKFSIFLSQEKDLTAKNSKKRKADLTCVVCGGEAIGYNFAQITCESCKGLSDDLIIFLRFYLI